MKRITLSILLAGTMLSQVASAQSSSTPIIGYYKQTFPVVGAYAVSVGFTAKKEFQGALTSTSPSGANTDINQAGATFGALANHYVEILSGANTGLILDVVGTAPGVVTVEGSVTLTAGTTYCIREHITLGGLLDDASGVVPASDLVILFDEVGNELNALYNGAGVWVDAVSNADLSNHVLYPGTGYIFVPGEDNRILTIGGGKYSYVKSGDTRVSLLAGIPTLVGSVNPLVSDSAPADTRTLTQFGLRVDPIVAGLGMTADSDLAILFSNDGVLDTVNNVSLASASNNLVDATSGANLNATTIRNGQSLLYVAGEDKSFVLPQTHP